MAFNTDPIQVKKMEYSIRDVDPLLQLQNNNNDEITNNNFKCHTIMNRYFLRGFRNTSLSVIEGQYRYIIYIIYNPTNSQLPV